MKSLQNVINRNTVKPYTVKEVIDFLSKYPKNTIVFIDDIETGDSVGCTRLYEENGSPVIGVC